MDDSCAVCADTLEWVSYGACGHKEVCSTCVARLRFICEDRRCCICKTESNVVFVTKALGDYTRMINDFAVFPSEVKEGRVGRYWYHEDTQAFFDDQDQYNMIKAMCRLSCSVCDNKVEEGQATDGYKKRPARFRNIEQLKGHLFHQHRLLMCSLCLEGRKVFICEQKLYTRAQLKQHVSTGDSEVDGTENERGGFMGHPVCEFCRTPFYGDNELYLHMSTEHYTCHICQRQHPGQYEYYKNYDDLEMHFRQEHFLCEDEACLGKKFVVFQSEAEMKRHNTLEHGGRMSRSQRSAALQIPTSFRYRRNNEQENRRGRGRMFRRDDVELSMAIEASLETSNSSATNPPSSSNGRVVGNHGESDRDRVDTSMDPFPIIQPFESLSVTSMDSEPPSRYLQAVSHRSRISTLQESSFPPLATGPSGGDTSLEHDRPEAPLPKSNNTMAAHLRRQSNKRSESNVHHNNNSRTAQQVWPTPANSGPIAPLAVNSRPLQNSAPSPSLTTAQTKPSTDYGSPSLSSYSSLAQSGPAPSVRNHPNANAAAAASSSSLRGWNSSKMTHSTSAPNLVETGGPVDNSISDFPPVSVVQQMRKVPTTVASTQQQQVVDVQSANKTLIERIHSALAFDQDKYTAFKDISGEYRKGLLDTGTYLAYVEQFGLSHLVPELARLLPDPLKQKELVDAYNSKSLQQNDWIMNGGAVRPREGGGGSSKGKGKSVVSVAATAENMNNSKNKLADDVINTVRKLQAGFKNSEEGEMESLSKDGYRAVKGKSKSVVTEPLPEEWAPLPSQPLVKLKDQNAHQLTGGVSNQNTGSSNGDGKGKQRKKTSKFHRIRLGDGSLAAHLDSRYSDPDPDPESDRSENPAGEGLPVRGVWRNGGGHKLLSMTSARDPKK